MFSRQSGVFIFGGLITIAVGRLFGLIELFIMGTALITCVVVATLLVITQKPNIEINRAVVPRNPEAGQIIEVELSVLTNSRIPACDVYESTEDGGRVHISLAPLPSGHMARASYQIATHHRGDLILGPAIVEVADPLGLSRRSKNLGQSTEVTVFPQSVDIDLPDPKIGTGELVDAIKRAIRNQPTSSEFRSMREYSVGDDPRRINWKVSAKREDLVVNEYETEIAVDMHITLDTQTRSYSPEGFERAVSVAASFARSTANQNDEDFAKVSINCGLQNFSISAPAEATQVLKFLARITAVDNDSIHISTRESGQLKVDVIITGNPDSQWIETTWKQCGSARIVVVIFCENSPVASNLPTHWFVLSGQQLKFFAESWNLLSSLSAEYLV
ncbi:MAG: DUF58 domain-containing protein [Actinomycetes bacterium]